MLVIQDAWRSGDLPTGAVATIGNYDGLHLGQKAVVGRVLERAGELGAPSLLVTFEPHPLELLRPDEAPKHLTTSSQKERLIEEAGLDHLAILRFDQDLAGREAEEFVRRFLVERADVAEVYVGEDFRFGRDREGDLETLRELGARYGFAAEGVPPVMLGGERVSSTRIRRALEEGDVEGAAKMLGRPYSLSGKVLRGDRMGKRLGWPTINIGSDNELVPFDGVYATRVHLPSFPATFEAATNIGTRPTVYENYGRVVESHVLDFSSDVYGQRVVLSFYKRLREERIFPTVMDLSAQIGRDVEATREFFLLHPPDLGS